MLASGSKEYPLAHPTLRQVLEGQRSMLVFRDVSVQSNLDWGHHDHA